MPDNENARAGEQRANQNKQSDSTTGSARTQEDSCRYPGSITFLESKNRLLMAKRFFRDKFGKIQAEQYGKEKFFKITTALCHDIHGLAKQLRHVEKYQYVCVVRGAPADGVNWNRTLRRSVSKNGETATFLDVPLTWVMFDIDKIPCPAATDPAADPVDAVLYAVSLLPPELWDVTFYWQFSSSQGISGNDTLSLHVWFYLDRPYTNAELKRYAHTVNKSAGCRLIDPALFNPVQVHYTARPLFEDGITDPLPVRSGLWRGMDDYATLNIPTPEERKPAYKAAAEYHHGLGYQGYLARIGDDKDGFRNPIMSAIASYVAANGIDGTYQEAVKAGIRAAIAAAPHGNRTAGMIERYGSDEYLDAIFEWVFAQERKKVRTPDTVTSLPPYYPPPTYTNAEKDKAAEDMKELIANFIGMAAQQAMAARSYDAAWEFGCFDEHAA